MDLSPNTSKPDNGPETNRRRSMSNVNELNLPDPTSSSNPNSLQTPTSSSAQLHSHFNHQTNNYRQTRHHSISSTPSSTAAIPHRLTTSNLHQSRIKRNHRSNSISSNTSTNSSTSTLPTTINRSNRRMSPFTDKAGLPSPCFVHSHLDSNLCKSLLRNPGNPTSRGLRAQRAAAAFHS
ncbi:hypothetical protein DFH28DRAFT_960222 [Melampsora americana]|nr:hypothetical protein DFH28DRAFT_960222 [Melampsora americana]